jgi:hypothetical protein
MSLPIFAVVLAGAACSGDGPSSLEAACRVVVNDCGNGDSMGACIDALGGQFDDCLTCIAQAGCGYVQSCTRDDVGCVLPRAYAPE